MLTTSQIRSMGGEVKPYQRNPNPEKLHPAEKKSFIQYTYNAWNDSNPIEFQGVDYIKDVRNYRVIEEAKYLWILKKATLEILLENTQNLESPRKKITHTNLTAGGKAIIGGELWFSKNGKTLFINYKSARYGNISATEWQAVLEWFKETGYSEIYDVNYGQVLKVYPE